MSGSTMSTFGFKADMRCRRPVQTSAKKRTGRPLDLILITAQFLQTSAQRAPKLPAARVQLSVQKSIPRDGHSRL
jgi:hypothetical protein